MKHRLWITLAAGVLLAAGCAQPAAENPPGSTSSSASSTRLPSSAPSVPRSLDASAYREKPCDLFTDEQAKSLGYALPGRPYQDAEGAHCFRNGESGAELSTKYVGEDLLGKIYRREVLWPAESASPVMVGSQPALKTNLPADEPCRVAVGLSGDQGIEVRIVDKTTDPCERATAVAEAIVRKLV
jgi:hypothetical protein